MDLHEIEKEIKDRFDDTPDRDGKIEQMEEKIDTLEFAVAHLTAFIAVHLRLSADEIAHEDGLTDW